MSSRKLSTVHSKKAVTFLCVCLLFSLVTISTISVWLDYGTSSAEVDSRRPWPLTYRNTGRLYLSESNEVFILLSWWGHFRLMPFCRVAPLTNTYFMKQLDGRINRVEDPSALPRENNELSSLSLFVPAIYHQESSTHVPCGAVTNCFSLHYKWCWLHGLTTLHGPDVASCGHQEVPKFQIHFYTKSVTHNV